MPNRIRRSKDRAPNLKTQLPTPPPVPIIFGGTGWLVVEKPCGMSIHNNPGSDLCSRLSQYLQSDQGRMAAIAFDPQFGLHPVHRLDKETSGTILLACGRQVFEYFSRQFTQGAVTKEYLALVHGHLPEPAVPDSWGSWEKPLAQKAGGRRNPQGLGKRSACRTQYRALQHSRHYTLVECRLLTGRIHQIRRHAVLSGHPVVGDHRYGSMRACRYLEKHHSFKRLGLHAASLTIKLPETQTLQRFEAAQLPHSIQRLLEADQM